MCNCFCKKIPLCFLCFRKELSGILGNFVCTYFKYSSSGVLKVLEKVAVLLRDVVLPLMAKLSDNIRDIERKRGVGVDKVLRYEHSLSGYIQGFPWLRSRQLFLDYTMLCLLFSSKFIVVWQDFHVQVSNLLKEFIDSFSNQFIFHIRVSVFLLSYEIRLG